MPYSALRLAWREILMLDKPEQMNYALQRRRKPLEWETPTAYWAISEVYQSGLGAFYPIECLNATSLAVSSHTTLQR